MGLREFLRGGYHDLKHRTVITDRSRPIALWVPQEDRGAISYLLSSSKPANPMMIAELKRLELEAAALIPAIDDENDVVSSDSAASDPDRRGSP